MCDNGDLCDGVASCDDAGACEPGAPPDVDDHNPCTADSCDPLNGVLHVALANGTSCSDGNACNGEEACSQGSCAAGLPPTLDDGNPCTIDECHATGGVVHLVDAGHACPDADRCNGDETCDVGGHCQPGPAPIVDDQNPCTADSCDAPTGAHHTPLAVGASCDDATLCNGHEACGSLGSCVSGAAPAIDDQNPCTADSCDAVTGVHHQPLAAGTLCGTVADPCGGVPICDGEGHCDSTGATPIDDGNPCTVDACGDQGPTHTPVAGVDDGNPCTIDECDPTQGAVHRAVDAGTACSDGDPCNGEEQCSETAVCEHRGNYIEDDSDPCTIDTCDPVTRQPMHTPIAAGEPCIDQGACGAHGLCQADGTCRWHSQPVTIDDGNPCTTDSCSAATGVVSHTPLAAGTVCNDRDACTDNDVCDGQGNCDGTLKLDAVQDDGNVCTIDVCDPVLGQLHQPGPTDVACGDRAFCDGNGKCSSGENPACSVVCHAQHPSAYDGGLQQCLDQCVIDTSNLCSAEAKAYLDCFTGANGFDASSGGSPPECQAALDALASCRNRCGTTIGGPAVTNYDGYGFSPGCVTFSCGPEPQTLQEQFAAAGTPCEPLDECASPATCDGHGYCYSQLPDDYSLKPCPGVGHYGAGFCYSHHCVGYGQNPCWDYSEADGPKPDGTPCQISECSTKGVCKRGSCDVVNLGEGASCDDGDLCNGVSLCDARWTCNSTPPVQSNDLNRCTQDFCDPATAAVSHTPVADGTSCNDFDACNGDLEACTGGTCLATVPAPIVDDHNPCTQDLCAYPGVVSHVNVPNNTSCSDGNVCNGLELCKNGVCTAGTGVSVPDDGNPCTQDICSPTLGPQHNPVAAGTPCPNANLCDGNETCNAAGKCLAGVAPTVDDNNVCTADTCDAVQGVKHAVAWPDDGNPCTDAVSCDALGGVTYAFKAVGTSCSDGNFCNGAEICQAGGVCASGAPPAIDDGNPCTVDTCTPGGVTHVAAAGGTPCSDGNTCNGQEVCNGEGMCLSGRALAIDDGNPCTVDSCDPTLGAKHAWLASCSGNRSSWRGLGQSGPTPRDSATGVFAESSGDLVVIGGDNAGVGLSDTWLFHVATSEWRKSAATPAFPTRAGASAAYDAGRKRVVVFGGVSGGELDAHFSNDVWLFDPVGDTWTQLDINVNPAPRAYASLGVDAQSGHYLMFGGVGATNFGDTWELDPDARIWTPRSGTGPSARAGATLAYDAQRHVLLLHGGGLVQSGTVSDPIGDTWEYQPALAQWQQVSSAGTSPQIAQSVVYASAEQQFVSFGGTRRSADVLGSFSTFNTAGGTWTSRLDTILGRAGHVSGYDPGSDNVLISAGLTYGESGLFTEQLADVWGYRPATNTVTQLGPQLSPGAVYRNLVFDSGRQKLVALALQPADSRDLIWEMDATGRWTHHDVAFADGQTSYDFYHFGPHLYDSRRHLVYALVEQQNTGVPAMDLLAWDGEQWRLVCTTKTPLLGSANASAYDAASDRILVFGGNLGGADWFSRPRFSANVYEVDPTTCSTVTRVAAGASPEPRAGASGVWDSRRSRLIVTSGDGLYGYATSTWAWDPRGQNWTQLAKTGPHPPEPGFWPRTLSSAYRGPTLAYDPVADKVLWLSANGDTWVLNLSLDQWTQADVSAGAPQGAAATFDGQKGSLVALDEQGSLWDWDGAAWHPRAIVKASPGARSGAVAAWAHGKGYGVLFGGVSGDGRRTFLRDTWLWRDGWTLASYPSANGTPETPYRRGLFAPARVSRSPSARAGAAFGITSTTGGRYAGVLFGGEDETGPLGDTWKLDDDGWVQVIPRTRRVAQPTARTNAAIACLNATCLMFGGKSAAGTLPTDSWSWSGDFFWTQGSGATPSGRWGHAMAADVVGNRVYLFGGAAADGTPLKDTWVWAQDNGWQKLNPRVSPPARFGHSMSFDSVRGHVVMNGGTGQAPLAFDDTWELDPVANTWLQRAPEQTIGPRAGHVSFFDEAAGRTILFGGLTYHADGKLVGSLGDTLAFDGADTTGDARLQLDLGVPCLVDAECNSGACVDGVCCNSPCGGQCSSCNLPGREGTCSPVRGNPVGGRPTCGGGDECALCNGSSLVSCGEADGTSCGLQGCIEGSFYTAGACSNRACTARGMSCAPFTCNATGCLSSCQKSADCYSSDYFCTGGRTCAPYAKLTSTSISPTTPQAFLPATLSVTSNVSAQFQYKVEYHDQAFYPCGQGWQYDSSCSWMVEGPGDAYWTVSTRAFGSDKVFDDSKIVLMHAVPYGQGGN